ncbi:MAG TPA: pyridoxamine 5'-phosphate oxidase family protein [Longimicrobiales bacterium]|nr:pyridoxamine 5'-phosphate oxidase family protein [Longimicrobiales bacterium]
MAKVYEGGIDERLRAFIARQRVFFVGSAAAGPDGHVNVSPKGLDTFRVLGPREVAYLDYVGSGAETIAHLRENGRITIMFCAFEGPPKVLRLHGRGTVLEPPDPGFAELAPLFADASGARSVIRVAVERVSDSCGYGVPLFGRVEERPQLFAWMDRKGEHGLIDYQREHNARSIDGLPALRWVTPD